MLSDRRQRVLAALIEEYVARALPVGSRTLTERYRLGVSSATVRNELSVLEEQGYISQPHTSAGRVPTDFGYRAFVDDLIASGAIQEDEKTRAAVARLRSSARELDDLMERTSSALAHLTDCLSIVLAPALAEHELKQITLISLDDHHAVIVLVTKSGDIFNRHLEFAGKVGADDLSEVQRVLNNAFCAGDGNGDFSTIAANLRESERFSALIGYIVDEMAACLAENEVSHSHSLGMTALMRKPEFSRTEALLPVMQALDDDTVLMQLFDDAKKDDTPIVKIGSENESKLLSGVSVVASRYGRGDSEGVVAVIGPTRMDYSRVLKAVRMASSALDDD